MSGRRKIPISLLIGGAIGIAGLVFVGLKISEQWDQVKDRVSHANAGMLAIALVLAIMGMTAIGLAWRPVLVALGAPPIDRKTVVRWYFVGEIGKYVPGGVWTVVGRAELARRGGLARSSAYGSVALSLLCLQVGAACVAAVALPFSGLADGNAKVWLILLVVPLGLGVLHPKVAASFLSLIRTVTKREFAFEVPPFATTLRLVAGYVPAWIAIGLSTAMVARALDPNAPLGRVFAGTVVSWIIGFIFIPTPGGIGVRESAFTAMVTLGPGIAVTTSLVARLIFMLVDGAGAALAPLLLRTKVPTVATNSEPLAPTHTRDAP